MVGVNAHAALKNEKHSEAHIIAHSEASGGKVGLGGCRNRAASCHRRSRFSRDHITPVAVARLAATLEVDAPQAGDPLPAGWHMIFCLDVPQRNELDTDGLPRGFKLIPPVDMPRRMFGGARLSFHTPLAVGEPIRCESELADAKLRSTATAHLAIATLRHRFFGADGLAVVEEQDIVHLQPIDGAREKMASPADSELAPTWQREIVPDEITLFRFSALTFNSHRIHYDRSYTAEIEKLPNLVVQGKFIALQLLETVRHFAPEATVAEFEYRSTRPLYAGTPCKLAAKLGPTSGDLRLWAQNADERIVQAASMKLAIPGSQRPCLEKPETGL
jgi:3-methylfumaryl-CoA hydratase